MISLKQALELEKRLIVECNRREVAVVDPRFIQRVLTGVNGERRVVLLAGEPFFLRRSHNLTVDEHCCGAVVVISRDSEDCPFHIGSFFSSGDSPDQNNV